MSRLGFACKWIDRPDQVDGIKSTDDCKKYNTGTTTVAWLNRQIKSTAEAKLLSLVKQNITAARRLVEKVGTLDDKLRMVRLSSDILPVYTHADYSYFYQQPHVKELLQTGFDSIGSVARARGVRLSFHPGQFCVLSSDRPDVVENSISEFEYHADMARWMGYGRVFQDMKINVHISGKLGPAGFLLAYDRLSDVAKNCITIENEEYSFGLDECLTLAAYCPIVLDLHHFWIKEETYFSKEDIRMQQIIDSWRGVRPVIHYSYSRDEHFPKDFTHDNFPDMENLLNLGYKKSKLRAHSNGYPNQTVNKYALSFLDIADIMCEAKLKNLASFELFNQAR